MKNNRRKKYLVNKKVQVKYASFITALLFVYTILLLVGLFAPHAVVLFSDLPEARQVASAELILLINSYIWPWIIVLMIISIFFSVLITHKIAGPVFVFNRTTKLVAGGDLSQRINLRKGDDMQDLADNFNLMMDSLDLDFKDICLEGEQLRIRLLSLAGKIEDAGGNDEEIGEMMKEIVVISERIEKISGKYRFHHNQ